MEIMLLSSSHIDFVSGGKLSMRGSKAHRPWRRPLHAAGINFRMG